MGDLKKHDRGEAHKLIKAIKEITDKKCDCELSVYGDGEEPRTLIMCSTGGLIVDPDTAEEVARLKEENDCLCRSTHCAYCGDEFPLDTVTPTLIGEHIRTCEKHPMRKVEEELKSALNRAKHEKDQVENYKGHLKAAQRCIELAEEERDLLQRKVDAAEKYIAEKKENLEREINDGAYSDQLALLLHLEKAMKEA